MVKRPKREEPKAFHKRGLQEEIEDPAAQGLRTKPRAEKKRRRLDEDQTDEAIDDKISSRILRVARDQQDELEDEERTEGPLGSLTGALRGAVNRAGAAGPSRRGPSSVSDEDGSEFGSDLGDALGSDAEYEVEEEEISAEDEKALRAFMSTGSGHQKTRTLADLIMEKIREKQQQQGVDVIPAHVEGMGDAPLAAPVPEGLDAKVVEVYQAVGQLMKRYTAGSVPKAFKIIPSLHNWEEMLYLTDPEGWTPHAVFQATRLFSSNLNAKMAQRFFSLVLLPRFRNDIGENRRLHFMLFQALKKALYKAGAFYKGFLLPLCEAGDCTLREAVILSSVLKRVSIPVIHSAAALLKMAEMPYCGTTSFFIRVLLDKKYALPYRVVDALVDHFCKFHRERRALPVVWHQSLLVFVQRYKAEIRAEDKEALKSLTRAQFHHLVSPEVHRELDQSRSRGQRVEGAAALEAQGRVGAHVREDVRDLAAVVMMEEDL